MTSRAALCLCALLFALVATAAGQSNITRNLIRSTPRTQPATPQPDPAPTPPDAIPIPPESTPPPITQLPPPPTQPARPTPPTPTSLPTLADLLKLQREIQEAQHANRLDTVTDEAVVAAMRRGAEALLKECQPLAAPATGPAATRARLLPQLVLDDPLEAAGHDGRLAMSLYALLVVHRVLGDEQFRYNSKEMAPLVQKVVDLKTEYTYALAMQASAIALLPARPEYKTALARVSKQLMANVQKDGSFGYAMPGSPKNGLGGEPNWSDNSNTQYGLLGAWACEDAGLEVANLFWKASDQWWRRTQEPDGGWGYTAASASAGPFLRARSTANMTAAGVASLYVTSEKLDTAVRLNPQPDANLENGLAYLVKDFQRSRLTMGEDLYYAYGIERVGLASGRKYFGKFDWFREGAAEILASQNPETGLWSYSWGANPFSGTSYALLFLARGRSPVVFNKLQYPGSWDARPRDVASVTRYLGGKTEKFLNWQIVDLAAQDPTDWLDAPILVITGHGDPKFTKEQLAKLRTYVQAGGLILSTSDGAEFTFSELIRTKYAPAIVDKTYDMRLLPKDHWIYTLDFKVDKGREGPLYALSNGTRELWIHSPRDMSAAWQGQFITQQREHYDVAGNLLAYVAGRLPLRGKLETLAVPDPPSPPLHKLSLARLTYPGNADPEPAAWPRFAKRAALKHKTAVDISPAAFDTLDPAKTPVVHLTGTAAVDLSDAQRNKLKSFLTTGGFLIVDSAGGNEPFAASLKKTLQTLLPDADLDPIDPLTHPLITGNLELPPKSAPPSTTPPAKRAPEKTATPDSPAGPEIPAADSPTLKGIPLKELSLRRYSLTPDLLKRKPIIYELKLAGRPIALFFDADLTTALLGTNTWAIHGYAPATAEPLAWNAILYAHTATQPAPKK